MRAKLNRSKDIIQILVHAAQKGFKFQRFILDLNLKQLSLIHKLTQSQAHHKQVGDLRKSII